MHPTDETDSVPKPVAAARSVCDSVGDRLVTTRWPRWRCDRDTVFTVVFGLSHGAMAFALGCNNNADGVPATDTDNDDTTAPTPPNDVGDVGEPEPSVPLLVSPPDGAVDVPTETELCWAAEQGMRYRVFVDGIELTAGLLAETPGHAGPCLGPLYFNPGVTFHWTAQAFAVASPEHVSPLATPWGFTTRDERPGTIAFEDDFEGDLEWEIEGTAIAGAWTRGNPVMAFEGSELTQPSECAAGSSCYFTGQNPTGQANEADVAGGATTLLSPRFELEGATAVTVTLRRFFYKGGTETGTSLRTELAIAGSTPDAEEYVSVLERIDRPTVSDPHNEWDAVEFALCDLPTGPSARLRITAADLGEGITEGAIDSVIVTAFADDTLCARGSGSICNPEDATSCDSPNLCCPQGPLNTGVFRCTEPARPIPYAGTDSSQQELGCDAPDLLVEGERIEPCIDFIDVRNDSADRYYCALLEGCLGGEGRRKLLRFDTVTPNVGSADLKLGVASNAPDLFHYSECHNHYHFTEYAAYTLLDSTGALAATGHKQAFCLLDWQSWASPDLGRFDGTYTCMSQGISAGWEDVYSAGLDCQWIDVTDVPDGPYTLSIAINQPPPGQRFPLLVERQYDNNIVLSTVDLATLPACAAPETKE